MQPTKKLVNPKKWPGIFCYQSRKKKIHGKPNVCYYMTYKVDGVKRTEKVGWKSEGYTPQIAFERRSSKIRKARHGETVKTDKEIRLEKQKKNKILDQIANVYFENRGGSKQAGRFDRYRYDKHVKPLLGKRTVPSISPLDVDRIKHNMKG